MFVDFDEVFNSKPESQAKIPDALVQYLSNQLPSGFKYVPDENGNYIVTSDNSDLKIGGLVFKPTAEERKKLGKNFTQDDVYSYFYNLQKPIPLQLEKEGYVILDGEEFPVNKLFFNAVDSINYDSGTFFMMPSPFPAPFKLRVGCADCERELLVSRVPNDSVSVSSFESDKEDPLRIKYLMDESTQTISISMNYDMDYAKTVRDMVEVSKIYNAYLDGKGYLCGQPLKGKLNEKDVKHCEEATIAFWEKVVEIEECLGIKFNPPHGDIDFKTICLVESLYQNLVNKVPVRESGTPETLNGIWDVNNDENFKNSLGKPIYFEFEATRKFDLFGVKFTLHGLLGILDAVFADLTQRGKKQKIVLADVSEERTRYTAAIYFKSEEELKKYQAEDHNKRIAAFHNAKRAREFLQ